MRSRVVLSGQRVMLRAVIGSTAFVIIADPTGPRVICKALVAIGDSIVANFQRRRLGSAHIRLVRPLTEFALEAPSATATGPTALRMVRRWRRWNEVGTSWGSVHHGVELIVATLT